MNNENESLKRRIEFLEEHVILSAEVIKKLSQRITDAEKQVELLGRNKEDRAYLNRLSQ